MRFVSGQTDTKRPIVGDDDTSARDAVLALWGDSRPSAVFGTWKVPRPVGTRQRLIWDKQDGTGAGMGDLDAVFGTTDGVEIVEKYAEIAAERLSQEVLAL